MPAAEHDHAAGRARRSRGELAALVLVVAALAFLIAIALSGKRYTDQDPFRNPPSVEQVDGEARVTAARNAYLCELDGTCGTSVPGVGPSVLARRAQLADAIATAGC